MVNKVSWYFGRTNFYRVLMLWKVRWSSTLLCRRLMVNSRSLRTAQSLSVDTSRLRRSSQHQTTNVGYVGFIVRSWNIIAKNFSAFNYLAFSYLKRMTKFEIQFQEVSSDKVVTNSNVSNLLYTSRPSLLIPCNYVCWVRLVKLLLSFTLYGFFRFFYHLCCIGLYWMHLFAQVWYIILCHIIITYCS